MVHHRKSIGPLVLWLLPVVTLLFFPQIGSTAGTWSVISLPLRSGEVVRPAAVAADAAGNLYVAESGVGRVQKRDAQGNWSVVATQSAWSLAVDAAGNLYTANDDGIQKRDPQGNWSLIGTQSVSTLAADAAGNLYTADHDNRLWQIRKRDVQGNWSVVAIQGEALGQVGRSSWSLALAVDASGNLYVADQANVDNVVSGRIQKRDTGGNWSVVATSGGSLGQVILATALAVDTAGALYVSEAHRIQKQDARGNWSVIATEGASSISVDRGGNLYVSDDFDLGRVRIRNTHGNWSVIATGPKAGWVSEPAAIAADAGGNVYVGDSYRIQKRDARGNWSVIGSPDGALAADSAGNLYVVGNGLRKRDAQGNWSVIAEYGTDPGQISDSCSIAMDAAGNFYLADGGNSNGRIRLQMRDAGGNWSVIATSNADPEPVWFPAALAADATGTLYLADRYFAGLGFVNRLQKRDVGGKWSVIGTDGDGMDRVSHPRGLAVDTAGNLYVADVAPWDGESWIHKRDTQGDWSVLGTYGTEIGQVNNPSDLAVDGAGNLYVADTGNHRVLKYTPAP